MRTVMDVEWDQVIDTYRLKDKGIVLIVPNPQECEDFGWLIHNYVSVGNQIMRVSGVERYMHNPPWRKGENIGLLIT